LWEKIRTEHYRIDYRVTGSEPFEPESSRRGNWSGQRVPLVQLPAERTGADFVNRNMALMCTTVVRRNGGI